MKKIINNKYLRYGLLVLAGLLLGWLLSVLFRSSDQPKETQTEQTQGKIWTCAMHPQIRKPGPGKCPICGMDLIPLVQDATSMDFGAIHLSKEAAALANVLTTVVTKQDPIKEIRLYGKVQADERLLQSQVSFISGRIEKLFINFTGESVRKGQSLALIYSPELVNAQQELLEAVKFKQSQPAIYEAVKNKLRQWKLTEDQITAIETSGKVQTNIEVKATTSGVVTSKRVSNGDYISQGTVLYEVADLSSVWIMFDAYESDLPFINQGDAVTFSVQAMPGINFSGKVVFIDPLLDPVSRVAKVRVEMSNRGGKLKPEMFVTGSINANLSEYKDKLIIPRSAVLWTGKRSIVYIQQAGTDEGIFKMREVELGPMLGNSYVIISGLNEGERIVTQGAFNVDAAAQLEGKPSMMNPVETKVKVQDKTKVSTSLPSGNQVSSDDQSMNNMDMEVTKTFGVSGLCELCKERIEKAAKSVSGVTSANWDVNTKKIKVEFKSQTTSMDAIQRAIAKVGHDTDKYKADDKTYNSLPECCKYRK
jgi:Cu(I)/Ag(I) efflux system membrane fusion protein